MMELICDTNRWDKYDHEACPETGIFVRAKNPDGKWRSVDIALLDKVSLLVWLKSRGGDNPWAEDVVGILLNHGHLHDSAKGANYD
jgi:hypothetical protein